MSGSFATREFRESAATFHAREIPDAPACEIWHNVVTSSALVLGSTQRDPAIVDSAACRALGVEVVRRRSGGGAVLLVPDQVVWFDVIVPRQPDDRDRGAGGPNSDDVHAPMLWVGERIAAAIASALESVGDDRVVSVKGPGMIETRWSRLVCFDGLGPGEVLLDGHKLVGISQRRTRSASRLQCSWYSHHDPEQLTELLAPDVRPTPGELGPVATLDAATSALAVEQLATHLSS